MVAGNWKRAVREPIQQRSKEKKARIISAARKLLNREDYETVTTNLIAQEAGVSIGTFYSYFRDKRDVFLSVVEQYSNDVYGEILRSIQGVAEEPGNLEAVVRRLIQVAKGTHDHERGLHKQMLIQSIRDEEIRSLSVMNDMRAATLFEEVFSRHAAEIQVSDVDTAIFLVKNCVEELIHHLILYGSSIPEDRVFDELYRMIYRYLSRP
jgi:AcrR family transcriptional regulator